MLNCVCVTFPCGVLGQVWYLILSIPDLCRLSSNVVILFRYKKVILLRSEVLILLRSNVLILVRSQVMIMLRNKMLIILRKCDSVSL